MADKIIWKFLIEVLSLPSLTLNRKLMNTLEDYIEQYGQEEGTRKWKNKERAHRYYIKNKDKHRQRVYEWRAKNKDKVKEIDRRCRVNNKEKRQKTTLEWRALNPKHYRAINLLTAYRQKDRRYGRGECTLTALWIVDNIFSKRCLYCGESDWHKLGCDRKNSNLPHTPENVVCSCKRCNDKRQKMNIINFALSIGAVESDGLIIKNPQQ